MTPGNNVKRRPDIGRWDESSQSGKVVTGQESKGWELLAVQKWLKEKGSEGRHDDPRIVLRQCEGRQQQNGFCTMLGKHVYAHGWRALWCHLFGCGRGDMRLNPLCFSTISSISWTFMLMPPNYLYHHRLMCFWGWNSKTPTKVYRCSCM